MHKTCLLVIFAALLVLAGCESRQERYQKALLTYDAECEALDRLAKQEQALQVAISATVSERQTANGAISEGEFLVELLNSLGIPVAI